MIGYESNFIEKFFFKLSLSAHYENDEDFSGVLAVEDAAWTDYDLTVERFRKLRNAWPGFREIRQLFHARENALHEALCSGGFVERDVIRNGIQLSQCGLGPDYFSHRFILLLACV